MGHLQRVPRRNAPTRKHSPEVMDSFFQHLKPAPAPTSSDAVKQLVRLEDLDRHTGAQSAPRTITDPVTNRKVLALYTIPPGAADSAPYDRNYPSSMALPAMSEGTILARTRSVLGRLEERLDSPLLPVAVVLPQTSRNATQSLVIGYPSGVDVSEPFTVAHLGGDSWRVSGGLVSGGGMEDNETEVRGRDVALQSGFIGFWVRLDPTYVQVEVPDIGTVQRLHYAIDAQNITTETSYANSGPTRSVSTEDDSVTWEPGRMFVALAWVQAPTSSLRPRIIPLLSGADLLFPDEYSGPGLPVISQA